MNVSRAIGEHRDALGWQLHAEHLAPESFASQHPAGGVDVISCNLHNLLHTYLYQKHDGAGADATGRSRARALNL